MLAELGARMFYTRKQATGIADDLRLFGSP